MQIEFSNGDAMDLILDSTPVANIYRQIYKHLQHAPVPFRDWDNPFYLNNQTYDQLVEKLIWHADNLSLNLDQNRCLAHDRDYFNWIHKIYEKNYSGDPAWLDLHEHIHFCYRGNTQKTRSLCIDYREVSGPLEKPFDPQWIKSATTKICAGEAFVTWAELGKDPYTYWTHNEPNDITRMLEVIKPWLVLRPKIMIALEDIDFLDTIDVEAFESWWEPYKMILCQHWGVSDWTINDMFGAVVFGKITDLNKIITLLKNNQRPVKISL
jgi:hypothetical protein